MSLKLSRVVALVGFAFGLFLFWFMVMIDYSSLSSTPFMTNPPVTFLFHLLAKQTIPGSSHTLSGIGPSGFVGFCLAVGGFMALKSDKGARTAISEGAILLAAPALIVFELGIWYLQPWEMGNRATNFVPWTVGGTYIFTNALVLFGALILFSFGVCSGIRAKYYSSASESRYFTCVSTIIVLLALAVVAEVLFPIQSPPVASLVLILGSIP